jgi:hypothetical protein
MHTIKKRKENKNPVDKENVRTHSVTSVQRVQQPGSYKRRAKLTGYVLAQTCGKNRILPLILSDTYDLLWIV